MTIESMALAIVQTMNKRNQCFYANEKLKIIGDKESKERERECGETEKEKEKKKEKESGHRITEEIVQRIE